MQFDNFAAFLAMEGHGVYVWPVYCVGLIVMVTLLVIPLRKKRRFFIQESMRQRREQLNNEQSRDVNGQT
ncbi:MAG: heme exporter protein CcmD [Pseudomonadales bacterium]